MFEIGTIQRLYVAKIVDFGVYLSENAWGDENDEKVLLPKKQVPDDTQTGDAIEVFLYRDSEDRLIATTNEPKLTLGKFALLKVKNVTKIGAFLDWGLEKDLFLPFKQQTHKVKEGEDVLAALYVDKSDRLCGTMKIYHYLKQRSPYEFGDQVKGRVYEISGNFGVFVAVDDKYSALIPKKQAQGKFNIGDVLDLRVTRVHEDGKLEVTPREKAYKQINADAEMVLERIEDYGGMLPFDDRAEPAVIEEEFGFSKAAFKRAVGRLLKEKKVVIEGGKIRQSDIE